MELMPSVSSALLDLSIQHVSIQKQAMSSLAATLLQNSIFFITRLVMPCASQQILERVFIALVTPAVGKDRIGRDFGAVKFSFSPPSRPVTL